MTRGWPTSCRLFGILVAAGYWLFYPAFQADAVPVKPRLRGVIPISRDGFVEAIWDIVPHQPPLEWLAQASLDDAFTQIASSSGWIRPKRGRFFLSVPKGNVFVRVGSREIGGKEVVWSGAQRSYQKDGAKFRPRGQVGARPKRPVVFIHGLGGQPGDWEDGSRNRDYINFLVDRGYERSLLKSYAYADYNLDGSYDAFGDIQGISRDLPSLIGQLRRLDQERGGEGKVDLVGYSLGGLVGRVYLKNLAANPGLGKFINLASPQLGINRLLPWVRLEKAPFGPGIRQALATLVARLYERDQARSLDLEGKAIAQLAPNSQFLSWLNSEPVPSGVEYHLLYGDLRVRFQQKLFHLNLISKEFALGDLVVDSRSATTLAGATPQLYPFRSSPQWDLKPVKQGNNWVYQLDLDFPDLKYWHSALPGQPEVKQVIWQILQEE